MPGGWDSLGARGWGGSSLGPTMGILEINKAAWSPCSRDSSLLEANTSLERMGRVLGLLSLGNSRFPALIHAKLPGSTHISELSYMFAHVKKRVLLKTEVGGRTVKCGTEVLVPFGTQVVQWLKVGGKPRAGGERFECWRLLSDPEIKSIAL